LRLRAENAAAASASALPATPPAMEMSLKVVVWRTPAWRVCRDAGSATERAARERRVRDWKCMMKENSTAVRIETQEGMRKIMIETLDDIKKLNASPAMRSYT
jgi:hypothetical protein